MRRLITINSTKFDKLSPSFLERHEQSFHHTVQYNLRNRIRVSIRLAGIRRPRKQGSVPPGGAGVGVTVLSVGIEVIGTDVFVGVAVEVEGVAVGGNISGVGFGFPQFGSMFSYNTTLL